MPPVACPKYTDVIVNVDLAYAGAIPTKLGPFELWDALGVRQTVETMEANDFAVALWVKEMLAKEHESFYRVDEGVLSYYDPTRKDYVSELG